MAYWCAGFCRVLVVPSPKVQSQAVGVFWLASVNCTLPVQVVVAFTVKAAIGGLLLADRRTL